nr:MAG TPA: hypothetical protein [Caudoviricetes sp.]
MHTLYAICCKKCLISKRRIIVLCIALSLHVKIDYLFIIPYYFL